MKHNRTGKYIAVYKDGILIYSGVNSNNVVNVPTENTSEEFNNESEMNSKINNLGLTRREENLY